MGIVEQILWFCQIKDTQRCCMYCLVCRSKVIYYLTWLFHNIKYQWLNPNLLSGSRPKTSLGGKTLILCIFTIFWKTLKLKKICSLVLMVAPWICNWSWNMKFESIEFQSEETFGLGISSIETFFLFQVNSVTSMTKSVIQLSLYVNLSGKILDLYEKKYSWLIPQVTNI